MRAVNFVTIVLSLSACVHPRPSRALDDNPLTARSIARAAESDDAVARAILCANEMLEAIPGATRARPTVRPFTPHRIRDAAAADAQLPLAVETGFAAHQVSREWSPTNDGRVGRWIALPMNMEFAMDTYVTSLELTMLYPKLAAAPRDDRTEIFANAFTIPRRFAEALADDYHFNPPADAGALWRFLSIRYYNRGRRFHCFDEAGRDLR